MHETVELIKALAWPCVLVYFLLKFEREIRSILSEMPGLIRRLQSAQGLGMEIKLNELEMELPVAEQQAQSLSLQLPEVPRPGTQHEGGGDG